MSRIALAQTTSTDDLEANLRAADAMIAEAAAEGAALLAFPEVFLYIGGRSRKLEIAEPVDGPLVSHFREAAARHGMMLLLGSLHERIAGNDEKVFNTSVLIGADGAVSSVYRKMKLFDVELPELRIKESDTIEPGARLAPVVQTPLGALGLTICFDLRFTHLYRHLREDGAEVVFVPSNFTEPTGAAHWSVLLRARAIENQVFIVAPAQFGQHNPRYRSYGHSLVVDPWGKVLVEAPDRTGLAYADIDLARVAEVRRTLPMG